MMLCYVLVLLCIYIGYIDILALLARKYNENALEENPLRKKNLQRISSDDGRHWI